MDNKPPSVVEEKISHNVTVLSQSDNLNREVIQRMLDTCARRKDSECLVCLILRRKLEAFTSPAMPDTPSTIEAEQSRIVRQHFPLCTPPNISRGSMDSTTSVGQQLLSSEPSVFKFNIGGTPSTGADGAAAMKQGRESQLSDSGTKHGGDTRALNYGLHNLIQETETDPCRNHFAVFRNIEQSQLNSVLAQVTCKDTLFKENESNARLLRIEQELNDLMNREDVARVTQDNKQIGTGSVVGGASGKKGHHEHGY